MTEDQNNGFTHATLSDAEDYSDAHIDPVLRGDQNQVASHESINSDSPMDNFIKKPQRKKRRTQNGLLYYIMHSLTNNSLSIDHRSKGDTAMRFYHGPTKKVLVDTQKALRLYIILEDSFPLPDEFDLTIEAVFNKMVQKALKRRCMCFNQHYEILE